MNRVTLVCALAAAAASGLAAQQEKPPMADDVFKNIQVLRGLTVDEFMGTMGFISASLSMNCSDCHDPTNAASYALDNPRKQAARRMIVMVDAINKANFGGRRQVTCYSCHRGADRPKITPSLAEQYSPPPADDPNEIELSPIPRPNAPTADQVFDRYIQALGGAQSLAALGSFIARGTYSGLLTRLVRYTSTRLGFNPTQIDYADYRTVSGVKMPFKVTTTWTDGQSIIELSELRANAPVDAARFARPTPPAR